MMTFIDVTPQEDIDALQARAEALQNQALQFRPILDPLQGLAQMAQSGVAALLQSRASRQQEERDEARSQALASLMGGGVTPAVGTSPIPGIVDPLAAGATPAAMRPPVDLLAGSVAAGPSAPAPAAPALPGSTASGPDLPALLQLASEFPELSGAISPLIQARMTGLEAGFTMIEDPTALGFAPGTVVQRGPKGGLDVLQRPTETSAPQTAVGKARADLAAGNITDDEFAAIKGKALDREKAQPKRFENADKLRDEFRASSKDFVTARDAYGRVLASGEDASAAGDMALIFNYMKVLDPGSVVRESEFATAAATGAFGERVKAAVNRIQTGERLSDEMREDFVDRAGRLFAKQSELQDQLRSEYTRLAERFDLDPQDVIVDFRSAATQAKKEEAEDRDLTRPVAPSAPPLVGGMVEEEAPLPPGFELMP